MKLLCPKHKTLETARMEAGVYKLDCGAKRTSAIPPKSNPKLIGIEDMNDRSKKALVDELFPLTKWEAYVL